MAYPFANSAQDSLQHRNVCFNVAIFDTACEQVRIQCEPGGRLVIAGMPEDPDNPWGVTPFRKVSLSIQKYRQLF